MKKKYQKTTLTCGRLVADIKVAAKELIKSKSYDLSELSSVILGKKRTEIEHYGLQSWYSNNNNFFKFIDFIMIDNSYILQILLELNVMPLSLEITKIAGNVFSRTLMGGRSERNEFLLLHAFTESNHLVPDKEYYDESKFAPNAGKNTKGKKNPVQNNKKPNSNDRQDEECESHIQDADEENQVAKVSAPRKKPSYAGGLVLEPKIGYYSDFVLILDFNSLYPTIMREFNICFTTVDLRKRQRDLKPNGTMRGDHVKDDDDDDYLDDDEIPKIPNEGLPPGILPTQITKLVESRGEVKKLLKDPNLNDDEKQRLDIKQKALKLTANSMYGCLGFKGSRFYAKPLAALITFKGREILMATKDLVERNISWRESGNITSLMPEVIYGDTDSIMINTKSKVFEDALKISTRVQSAVNKDYKHLEIDCDGVLKCMLLLKKKKYAALTVSKERRGLVYKKEMKGLDIVRRDWSMISKTVGETVVDEILCIEKKSGRIEPVDRTPEEVIDRIHQLMKQVAEEVRSGKRPLGDFVITKQLTKDPLQYQDRKSLSHVLVAIKWNESPSNSRKFKSGDVVPFVVVRHRDHESDEGKSFNTQTHTQRGVHPEALRKKKEGEAETPYIIDAEYYLSQQIHPVVARLIEPLDGTDAHTIAEFLGLDPSSYHSISSKADAVMNSVAVGSARYETCDPLTFKCPVTECNKMIEVRCRIFKSDVDKRFHLSMISCPFCNGDFTAGLPDPVSEPPKKTEIKKEPFSEEDILKVITQVEETQDLDEMKSVTTEDSDDKSQKTDDGEDRIVNGDVKEDPVVAPSPILTTVTNNGLNVMMKRIVAMTRLRVRQLEARHKDCYFTCEDPACPTTVQIPEIDLKINRGPKCQECRNFHMIRDVSLS